MEMVPVLAGSKLYGSGAGSLHCFLANSFFPRDSAVRLFFTLLLLSQAFFSATVLGTHGITVRGGGVEVDPAGYLWND
jgi:hypothetical protein